jgi:hypothetical protein
MKRLRGLLTLEQLHFPQLLLMLLVLVCLALLVAFWNDVWALWRRPSM